MPYSQAYIFRDLANHYEYLFEEQGYESCQGFAKTSPFRGQGWEGHGKFPFVEIFLNSDLMHAGRSLFRTEITEEKHGEHGDILETECAEIFEWK